MSRSPAIQRVSFAQVFTGNSTEPRRDSRLGCPAKAKPSRAARIVRLRKTRKRAVSVKIRANRWQMEVYVCAICGQVQPQVNLVGGFSCSRCGNRASLED